MTNKAQQFTLRIDAVILEKLRYIAEKNCRTINKELEMLVHRYIAEYEHTHGVIKLHDVKDSEQEGHR